MAKRIQLRRDISSNWDRLNPVLAQGEIGIDLSNKNFKIGDGVTDWENLEFAIVSGKLGRVNVDTYIETGKNEDEQGSIYFYNIGELTAEFGSEITTFLKSALLTANITSTDPNSGSLVVQGGVGISDDLNVGGIITGGTINGLNFNVGLNGKFNGNLEGTVFGDVVGDIYNSSGTLVLESGAGNVAAIFTGIVNGDINSTNGSYLKSATIEESTIDKTPIGQNNAAFIRGTRIVAISQFEGNLKGNVTGNIYPANNSVTPILQNGDDGTDAVFYGTVQGKTIGSFIGNILASDSTRTVFTSGQKDSPNQQNYEPAMFYGNVIGDINSNGTSIFSNIQINEGTIDGTQIGQNNPKDINGLTVSAENFLGIFTGPLTGTHTGDVLREQDGQKVLENGQPGVPAWFKGSIRADDDSIILDPGTGGDSTLPTYVPAEFIGNVIGNLTGNVLAVNIVTETLTTAQNMNVGSDLTVTDNLDVSLKTTTNTLDVGSDATITGNLTVNGGDINSTNNLFNLMVDTVATANLFSKATAITIANNVTANSILSIGATTDQNTLILASTPTGTVNINGNITSGTLNLFPQVTTGTINVGGAGASVTNIGGAGSTLNVGKDTDNSTINLIGKPDDGAVNLSTNAPTVNIFNTDATSINLGGQATSLSIGSDEGTTTIKHNLIVDQDTEIKGDLLVDGDLEVKGTLTYFNTTNTEIKDNIITLNKGEAGAGVTSGSSGLEVDRGTEDNASIVWNETTDTWDILSGVDLANLNLNDLNAAGNITVVGDITVTGNIEVADITAENLTTNSNITVTGNLQVDGTSSFNDDVIAKNVTLDNITVNEDISVSGDLEVEANTILANLSIKNAGEIKLFENQTNGTAFVGLRAPTQFTDANSFTITLPSAKGVDGNILAFNTDGDRLEFISADLFGGSSVSVSGENGSDLNDGINKPVKTIKRALQIASGMVYDANSAVTDKKVVIKVASGDYYENNPIIIPDNVSIVGAGLRAVNLRPLNQKKDMFRVRNGCYFTEITFRDALDAQNRPSFTFDYTVAFDDPSDTTTSRIGYINLPITKPTITISPYIQNCSIISFLGGNGVLVDGRKVNTPNIPFIATELELENNNIPGVPQQGKSMVANAFTMLSFGGTGWRVINDAYAQIVSCFQIFCLNGSYCQSGGYLSITNSATNFGQFALRASGYSKNAFDFNKGYVISSNTILGQTVLTAIGFGDLPKPHYVIRIRQPNYRQARDLILAWRDELAVELISWINTQILNNTAPFTSSFVYNTALCERDSKIILDAVAYDVLSGGNSKIIEAAQSYNTSTITNLIDQKEENIAAFTQLRNLTLLKVTGTGLSSYVQSKFDLLITMLTTPSTLPIQVEYTNIGDITNDYMTFGPDDFISFDASLVNSSTNVITITAHNLDNMTKVSYSNNGNLSIPGLDDEQIYFVNRLNDNQLQLWTDESQTKIADILGVSTGTHQLIKNIREFFVDDIVTYHKSYQKLTLPLDTYTFILGRDIFGEKTGAVPLVHHAYVLNWDPTTKELLVSLDVANDSDSFQIGSIITGDHSGTTISGGITVINVIDQQDYYTAQFKVASVKGGSTFNINNIPIEKQIWLHRPSIVNSSGHTWEYAGSGIDYNALPQNGGKTRFEYEQVNDLPGRVYSSGTNELGDFKVGNFIKAENKTGNVIFTNTVSITELDTLKLSIGEVQISELSNDVDLGDNEPDGAQDYRLSTQLATRSFIQNKLGPFIDREVTTNNIAGAVPQLNSLGLLNPDVIPPVRNFLVWKSNGYGSRINLINTVPATNVLPGDISTETYSSVELRFQSTGVDANGDPIFVTADDFTLVTQSATGATGRLVGPLNNSSFAVVGSTDLTFAIQFDSSPVTINGVTYSLTAPGLQPVGTILTNQTTNWILSEIEPTQFLILNPTQTYNFTGINSVSGSLTKAQGFIDRSLYTNGLKLGVIRALDNIGRNPGNDYANGTFKNVDLTGGSGTGAKGDFTVINNTVSSFDITSGGEGYAIGDILGANLSLTSVTGQGGFSITVTLVENRLYIENIGGVKFSNSEVTDLKDFIQDVNALSTFIVSSATTVISFNANQGVNTTTNIINIPGHGFNEGDPVLYDKNNEVEIGGTSQGPQDGQVYYIKKIDDDNIKLRTNYSTIDEQIVSLYSSGTGTQNFILSSIDLINNTIYLEGHGYLTGTSLRITGSDLPTNLDDGKIYYVGSVTTNSFTLHEDKSDADNSIDGVVLGAIDFQNKGTGNITFTRQNIRVDAAINTSSGKYINWSISSASTIAANNIISGIISPSRLGLSSANNKTFLRGDSRYAVAVQTLNKASNSAINILGNDFTASTSTIVLQNVVITGIAGQFSCDTATLDTGYVVTITGTDNGNGNITNYADSTQYKISITNETNTFTLVNLDTTPIVTQPGSTTGLTFTMTAVVASNYFNTVTLDVDVADGQESVATEGGAYTNLGVARFNRSQFEVGTGTGKGNITIKDKVIDAGELNGQNASFYLNPGNFNSAIPVDKGGTFISAYATGDMLYASDTAILSKLNIGTPNTVLASSGSAPYWTNTLTLDNLIVNGGVNVTGSASTLNAYAIKLDDNNIELGSVSPITARTASIPTIASGSTSLQTIVNGVTTGMIPGMSLTKVTVAGETGSFGYDARVLTVLSASQFISISSTFTLSNVAISGTNGQFSCNSNQIAVGQLVTISGTFTGTGNGSILNYNNPTTYRISAITGTTSFTLVTTGGATIVTTIGGTSGLTFTISTLPTAGNITFNVGGSTDFTADNGGLTLKSTVNKTLTWSKNTSSWTSSENMDLSSGKSYKINGTDVLSTNTILGKQFTSDAGNIVTSGSYWARTFAFMGV